MTIPAEHKHIFKAVAYMIERKLLDMQMHIIAHRHSMRFVSIEYMPSLTEKELAGIEEGINKLYDLLEIFCYDYSVPKGQASLKAELMIKSNFLWEDISGASSKSMRGYGKLDESLIADYKQKIISLIDTTNELIQQFNKN